MNLLDKLEHFLIIFVSRLAPWAAPLAPAYLVARSIQVHFNAPVAVGVAVGVTLEAVGVASSHITLEMHNYNTDPNRLKGDPHAPFWLGLIATCVYFVSGFVLTVLLEVWPQSVKIAPALFFILAGVAYVTLALISGHSRRVAQIKERKEERRHVRSVDTDRQLSDRVDIPVRQWQDKAGFLADPNRPPDISPRQLADVAGISERTAYRWLDAAQNGKDN